MAEGREQWSGEENVLWQNFEADLMDLCQAKAEEFHLLGYEEVTRDEVWACVHARQKGNMRLHEVVASILGLNIGTFMNMATVNAYKGVFADDQLFDAQKRG